MNGEQLMAYCGIMVEDAVREDVREVVRLLIKAVSVILRRESRMDGLDYALIADRTLSDQQSEYLAKRYRGGYLTGGNTATFCDYLSALRLPP